LTAEYQLPPSSSRFDFDAVRISSDGPRNAVQMIDLTTGKLLQGQDSESVARFQSSAGLDKVIVGFHTSAYSNSPPKEFAVCDLATGKALQPARRPAGHAEGERRDRRLETLASRRRR
jgi:hypothetical protein